MKKLLLSIIAVLSLQIAQAQQLQTQNPLGIKIVSTGNYFISSAQIAELCVGENLEVIVHSTIVNNYQYNISGPATIPSQISQTSVTFNFPIAGVYQIWIEIPPYPNPPTPPTSAVFTILVTDSPIIFNNINIPSLFCEDGLSTDLSTYISVTPVNSTLSYTCSTLVISLNGVFQNNQIGSHNITITAGSNGCESTIQHHIDIIANPVISFNPFPCICDDGGVTDLSNYLNYPAGSTLSFSCNTAIISSSGSFIHTLGTHNIIVTCTDPQTTCSTIVNQMITVHPMPNVSFVNAPTSLCTDDISTDFLTFISTTGTNVSFSSNPSNISANGILTNTPGQYDITATAILNCCTTSTTLYSVNVYQSPSISISASINPICTSQSTILIVSGGGNGTYSWNTGISSSNNILTVSPNTSTTYTVTYTDNITGCQSTSSIYINVIPPTISFDLLPLGIICFDPQSTITTDLTNYITYPNPGSTINFYVNGSLITSSLFSHNQPIGFYDIIFEYIDPNGCTGTTQQILEIMQCCTIPNAIDINNQNSSQLGTSTIINQSIVIHNTLNIDANFSFQDCDIYLDKNAKINVLQNKLLTIRNCTLRSCDQENMWDGIYVEEQTAIFSTVNSYYYDAKNAIVSRNNGKIDIDGNTFDNNNIHILIEDHNYYGGTGGVTFPSHSADIKNNQFLATPGGLLNPYLGQTTKIGIKIDNVYKLHIGFYNTFDGMKDWGVFSKHSDITIERCYFKNILQPPIGPVPPPNYTPTPQKGYAICAWEKLPIPGQSPAFEIVKPRLTVMGNNDITIENFENCYRSVFSYNHYLNIADNTISNCNGGFFAKNVQPNSIISNNHISLTPTNYTGKYAIYIRNIFPTTMNFNIENNYIENAIKGIFMSNISGYDHQFSQLSKIVKIKDNEIYFSSAVGNRQGINIEKGDYLKVEENTIEQDVHPSGLEIKHLSGIYIKECASTSIYKNYIKNMGRGIAGAGLLNRTLFTCNTLDKCFNGFYFLESSVTTSTIISNQFGADFGNGLFYSSDNYWVDHPGGGYPPQLGQNPYRISGGLNNPSGNEANWYFRDNGGTDVQSFNPQVTLNLTPNPEILLKIFEQPNSPFASFVCSPHVIPILTANDRDLAIEKIVLNNNSYNYLDNEVRYNEKEFAFDVLNSDSSLLNMGASNDVVYQNFYNLVFNSSLGDFKSIQKLIGELSIDSALLQNQAIITQNLIEQNQKIVNDIYLSTYIYDSTLSSQQYQTLLNIAMLTPYLGGDAVFSARVMLDIDIDDYAVPYRLANPNNGVNQIVIYPNPTTDILNIEIPDDFEQLSFELIDILGRMHIKAEVSTNIYKINTGNLKEGVYILKVKSFGKNIATERIVKIK